MEEVGELVGEVLTLIRLYFGSMNWRFRCSVNEKIWEMFVRSCNDYGVQVQMFHTNVYGNCIVNCTVKGELSLWFMEFCDKLGIVFVVLSVDDCAHGVKGFKKEQYIDKMLEEKGDLYKEVGDRCKDERYFMSFCWLG